MKRAIIIVLDAVGIGELPDADKYGDKGSNTLMHVKEALPSLNLKNMCDLGLGLIDGKNVYEKVDNPKVFTEKWLNILPAKIPQPVIGK